jgi:RNA polymerase sigma factor (sigma-70 family)
MAARSETLLRYIRRLAIRTEPSEASDAALLGRFIADRDEQAFAALVNRHAALVFQVCWRILGDVHDAQDAFQATFLVLARKADTVHPPEMLPGWLHGVARRVALKARAARAEQPSAGASRASPPIDPRPDPMAELSARELLAIVDEEVRRLAEVYRLPVILCCLEGRSQEEAAQQLGWTKGSVKGRLERGRARLRERLARRGLMLSAVLTAAEVSRGAASALPMTRLTSSTIQGAMAFAARQTPEAGVVSAAAVAGARDFLRSMGLLRLKIAVGLMLATSLVAAGVVTYRTTSLPPRTSLVTPSPFASANDLGPTEQATVGPKEKEGRRESADTPIEVRGRVFDPRGKPFAGARLYVAYSPRRYEPEAIAHWPVYPVRATSGTDGRFRFRFTRSELDERYLDASRPVVVAAADGLGLDWSEIGARATDADLALRLVKDLPLEGRILDADRRPVAGATVFVRELRGQNAPGDGNRGLDAVKYCRGPLPGQGRVTTAADGRFRLAGVGRDRFVTLLVEGPAIPATVVTAVTRPAEETSSQPMPGTFVDFRIAASRSIQGVVRDRVTGAALAGVKISAPGISFSTIAATYTDEEGRYQLLGLPRGSEYVVLAQSQSGPPYFTVQKRVPELPGAGPLRADFEMSHGIPLRGRVSDPTTGGPPKRATIEYYPLACNPRGAALSQRDRLAAASSAPVRTDGSYSLTVLPGPGVVLVAASPRDSYASALLDERELVNLSNDERDHGGGSWVRIATGAGGWSRRNVDRYNALALIAPDERAESVALDFTLQPAIPLRGTVVGPDGEPLAGVRVSGLTSMPDTEVLTGASFTIEGRNPRGTRTLAFHDQEKGLGKVVTVRGDETRPLTVQLEPCGAVVGRFVDKAGRPAPGVAVRLTYAGQALAVEARTDRQGRFRAELVPGLSYELRMLSAHRLLRRPGAIEAGLGRITDLGDLPLGE